MGEETNWSKTSRGRSACIILIEYYDHFLPEFSGAFIFEIVFFYSSVPFWPGSIFLARGQYCARILEITRSIFDRKDTI